MRVVLVCPGWLRLYWGTELGGADMRVMLVCPGWLLVVAFIWGNGLGGGKI